MQELNGFISKHGFVLPNNQQEQSENGVLFSVVFVFIKTLLEGPHFLNHRFCNELAELIFSLHSTNNGEYRTLPNDDNPRFSLDNAMAVAAFCRMRIDFAVMNGQKPNKIDIVNLEKINFNRYWIRFYDVMPFLFLCRFPMIKLLIFPWAMVYFFTVVPCFIYGNGDSSGRQLALVKIMGLRSYFLMRSCEFVMNLRGINFLHVFATYYPSERNKNGVIHPIVKLAQEMELRSRGEHES
jgi:hypothetical protein